MDPMQDYNQLMSDLMSVSLIMGLVFIVLPILWAVLVWLNLRAIKKNTDLLVKIKTFEFERDNPNKNINDIKHDRTAYYRVRF